MSIQDEGPLGSRCPYYDNCINQSEIDKRTICPKPLLAGVCYEMMKTSVMRQRPLYEGPSNGG